MRRAMYHISIILLAAAAVAGGREAGGPGSRQTLRFQRLSRRGAATRVSPLDLAALRAARFKDATGTSSSSMAVVQESGHVYGVYHVEFDRPESCTDFQIPGVSVFARFERFADMFLPYENDRQTALLQHAIHNAPGVVRAEPGGLARTPPPPPRERTTARGPGPEPEAIASGGVAGLTGKGVIVAIVDSGIDFRNADFITYDAEGRPTSRLLYLWDTTSGEYAAGRSGSRAPLSYPDGPSVGTLYTGEQLTGELRAQKRLLPASDLNGHGTACAGIAAGNGNNSKGRYAGVAPEADLIGVRITGEPGGGTENSYLIGAICGWLNQVAGARPCVVSCSFGGHYGGHDGNLVEERQLNARFASSVKGRAVCIAAGNEGSEMLHAEAVFEDERKPARLTWKAEEGARVSLFFDTDQLEELAFAPAPGARLGRHRTEINPITRRASLDITVPAGPGGVVLTNSAGKATKCDAYLQRGSFDASVASCAKQVCTPGLANNAIAVGSYDWNDLFELQGKPVRLLPNKKPMTLGALSSYSNPGPSRNAEGTVKPDLVAPGQFFAAPNAKHPDGRGVNPGALLDASGNYQLFNGTSAATPYVAGVVALLLQKKPTLTVGEIRELLHRHASVDRFTGSVPNPGWGYGKLDLKAVRAALESIR